MSGPDGELLSYELPEGAGNLSNYPYIPTFFTSCGILISYADIVICAILDKIPPLLAPGEVDFLLHTFTDGSFTIELFQWLLANSIQQNLQVEDRRLRNLDQLIKHRKFLHDDQGAGALERERAEYLERRRHDFESSLYTHAEQVERESQYQQVPHRRDEYDQQQFEEACRQAIQQSRRTQHPQGARQLAPGRQPQPEGQQPQATTAPATKCRPTQSCTKSPSPHGTAQDLKRPATALLTSDTEIVERLHNIRENYSNRMDEVEQRLSRVRKRTEQDIDNLVTAIKKKHKRPEDDSRNVCPRLDPRRIHDVSVVITSESEHRGIQDEDEQQTSSAPYMEQEHNPPFDRTRPAEHGCMQSSSIPEYDQSSSLRSPVRVAEQPQYLRPTFRPPPGYELVRTSSQPPRERLRQPSSLRRPDMYREIPTRRLIQGSTGCLRTTAPPENHYCPKPPRRPVIQQHDPYYLSGHETSYQPAPRNIAYLPSAYNGNPLGNEPLGYGRWRPPQDDHMDETGDDRY